jgi:hypothetical protein
MGLTRAQVQAAIAARKMLGTIPVPEWGGEVHVRRLSSADLEKAGFFDDQDRSPAGILGGLLLGALCTDDGSPLFESIEDLRDADFPLMLRLFQEAARRNGIPTDDFEGLSELFGGAQDGRDSSE